MAKHNGKNARIKREYFQYLREARGHGTAAIDAVAKAISRFEESSGRRDFATFHREQAVAFKRKLGEQLGEHSGKPLSQSTIGSTLRALREFFVWLAGQPGYKSKIRYSDADYFNQSDKEQAIARATRPKNVPTLDQVQYVLSAMPASSPIERRNRALVSLASLTGARDGALASLRLKHVDLVENLLWQDAREVRTKFSKTFSTWFFPVGGDALAVITAWINWLRDDQHWGGDDPLFPATQIGIDENGGFAAVGLARHVWSTTAPIRNIFREACAATDVPYFNPHTLRDMLAQFGERRCRTPEEFKAWSQNLSHKSVLTTLTSYGILDVLQNYVTYKRFFGLVKQVEHDPDVPKQKAANALGQYLELHPVNIEQVIAIINERFGTDFTEADQLFFDQVRATAERDEQVVEAAHANNFSNFTAFFGRILEDLFIDRMDGNEEIFRRVMSDKQFRGTAQDHLAREIYDRLRLPIQTPPDLS